MKKIKDLEKQMETTAAEHAEREKMHQAEKDALRDELLKAQRQLKDTQTELADVKAEYASAKESFRIKEEAYLLEQKRQQQEIRKLTSELHEAIVLAKYMREAMLKAKRDAAGCVSPAKFAELIAQLEAMKENL